MTLRSTWAVRALACSAAISTLTLAPFAALAADPAECKAITLSDPGWTDITATNGVAAYLLETLGYDPEVKTLSVPIGYQSMKNGEIDVFLGNWMPAQQAFIDDLNSVNAVEVLNKNLEGAKFTLAVPTAAAEKEGVKDFADLSEHADAFDQKIYGIEPGAPANTNIQKMIDSGDFNLKDWELVESGEQAMLAQVERANNAGDAIVFLAWAPHPMNERFDITYLSGGDEYFGANYGGAEVYTLARTGWPEQCPNAAKFLSQLTFSVVMENVLMGEILGGEDPQDAAKAWLKENPSAYEPWLAGVTTFEGEPAKEAVDQSLGL
ncbi:glycine betaine/proline transport system substrate-binding protein [Pseudorhizobium tarimense]|uniref:Glycine betaine/proline transport system substrate-binding protein n=1 Tax=Pseudorhizobium tarimense TaxID=1079109 RepID=A0ABV2H216_9HYPH|nr:choline ABC transporter substrate-binding protein [Pseudorhizobium tarimense]MCJ8517934.1 choline ABC transporter substrate-binding protein [Pseudorhizobium tarimense]